VDRSSVERYRLFLFGGMVRGVSHEVDNHLSVVLGFAELSRMPGGSAEKMSENAGKIFAAGERIASIVKTFSHHARPHSSADETCTLRDLVPELIRFARYDLCRGNVSLRIAEDLPASLLRGDTRDLGLALLAVLFNGAESMSDRRDGELSLTAVAAADGLEIAVTDDGPGIHGDIFPRIFEEGFTTKPREFHPGMGLPVARLILEAAGGSLGVENRPGGGCRSVIRLPVS